MQIVKINVPSAPPRQTAVAVQGWASAALHGSGGETPWLIPQRKNCFLESPVGTKKHMRFSVCRMIGFLTCHGVSLTFYFSHAFKYKSYFLRYWFRVDASVYPLLVESKKRVREAKIIDPHLLHHDLSVGKHAKYCKGCQGFHSHHSPGINTGKTWGKIIA